MLQRSLRHAFAGVLGVAVAAPAWATWSIIVVNRQTREIGFGAATCLEEFNLQNFLPVVRPEIGAGAAQASVDVSGRNRRIIWRELALRTDPNEILDLLADRDGNSHRMRQYGIGDTLGRATSFSGSSNGAYANDIHGVFGLYTYSIQGNVITNQSVLDEALRALMDTAGGIPEKLMLAMEAAAAMGGDGRCSCPDNDPPCNDPIPGQKTAHCAFMIVTRRGNVELGNCMNGVGCATGDYYMQFNIANQTWANPDPVLQLRQQFDAWRLSLVGIPDATESRVSVTPNILFNDGVSTATLRIELRDWQGLPTTNTTGVTLTHDPLGSANSATIGTLSDLGGGVYEATLTVGTAAGLDRLLVQVNYPDDSDADNDDEIIYLIPDGQLLVQDQRADRNGDGIVDLADLALLLDAFGVDAGGDVDGDGDTDLADLAILIGSLPPDLGG